MSAVETPDGEPWQADDGTCWVYSPGLGIWTGWQPGEDGVWTLDPEEFVRSYRSTLRLVANWSSRWMAARVCRT